jgi:hypothetical protein
VVYKIQIYARCFWGSTSFGMWHIPTGVLFSQYFNWMFSLHCRGSMILTLQPLKMKALCSFKTLVHTSPPVDCYIPEDLNSNTFWYCLARLIWLWFGCIKLCVIVVELLYWLVGCLCLVEEQLREEDNLRSAVKAYLDVRNNLKWLQHCSLFSKDVFLLCFSLLRDTWP